MVFITARIAFIFVSSTAVHVYMIFIYLRSFIHYWRVYLEPSKWPAPNVLVEANTFLEARNSYEEKIRLSFERWNLANITCALVVGWFFITAWGNRNLTSHLPLRLVRFFLAAPRDQSVRGWPVHPAEFHSDRGTMGEFQLLPLSSPVW